MRKEEMRLKLKGSPTPEAARESTNALVDMAQSITPQSRVTAKIRMQCDGCQTTSQPLDLTQLEKEVQALTETGWTRHPDIPADYCPKCTERPNK